MNLKRGMAVTVEGKPGHVASLNGQYALIYFNEGGKASYPFSKIKIPIDGENAEVWSAEAHETMDYARKVSQEATDAFNKSVQEAQTDPVSIAKVIVREMADLMPLLKFIVQMAPGLPAWAKPAVEKAEQIVKAGETVLKEIE